MAVPSVASAAWVTRTGTNGTFYDITFPAVVARNDLIVVFGGIDGDPGTVTAPAGWEVSQSAASTTCYVGATYLCNGTEGGTLARFNFVNGESAAWRVWQVKGARPTTTIEAAAAASTNATPNAPALTPAAGADEWLWLVGMVADLEPNHSAYPTNCPDLRATQGSYGVVNAGNGVRVSVAGLASGSRATLDPDVFTIAVSQPWRARTMAVRPGIVPVASFTWALDPSDPEQQTVNFVGSGTEAAYGWLWDFGDGTTSTLQSPTHVYADPGTYPVTFIATNHIGDSAWSFQDVVAEPPPPPGRPALLLTIDGISQVESCDSANWSYGRTSWFDDLEPSTATFTFVGKQDVPVNAKVIAKTEEDVRPLWTGYVTDCKQVNDPNDVWRTTLSCTDALGRLGSGVDRDISLTAGTLAAQAVAILSRMGFPGVTVEVVPTTVALPTLLAAGPGASKLVKENLLNYLGLLERTSNAILVLKPDGNLRAMVRAPLPAGTVEALPLVGDDSPSSWTQTMSGRDVINSFAMTFRDSTGDEKGYYAWREGNGGPTPTGSIGKYGVLAYVVDDAPIARVTGYPTEPTPKPWPAAMRAVVAEPRFVVDEAGFHVVDREQAIVWLQPLDRVAYDGVNWQVMTVEHRVDPWTWDMRITADQTQDLINGGVDPPPSEVNIVTLTYNAPDKDTQVMLSSSGMEAGSGKGDNLAVGYWQGYRWRTCIDFPLVFPAGHKRVTKATLYVTTSSQVQVGFGSSPQVIVRRIIESWAEGTYVSNDVRNATIWPGPDTSGTNAVTKTITRSEGVEVSFDVTGMVETMRANNKPFGFRLHSANEDSSSRTTEFRSREFGSGVDARLVVKVEVAV